MGLAQEHLLIRGVVGWVSLTDGAGVARHFERLAKNRKFRGVRHVIQDEVDPRYILREDFNQGVRTLLPLGLRYDILIFERHLPAAMEFVDKHPKQVFILDHIAKPRIKDRVLTPWDRNMRELAKRPNVYCKLSGMLTEADTKRWTPAQRGALGIRAEATNVRSDWPVTLLAGDYVQWYGLVTNAISKLSKTEQDMGGTAIEAYGLEKLTTP